jgi:glycosyltransferase involved in cell wall biosynthesis
MDKISFVIPCFNNEENIDDLFHALFKNEKQFSDVDFEYVLVDDASEDRTFEILTYWQKKLPEKIKLLQLKKNIGSHKAVFRCLPTTTGDCVIVMAADLQDPPEFSVQLYNEWKKGSWLVLAVKDNTPPLMSKLFHLIMKNLFVTTAPNSTFDYTLFDQSLIIRLQEKSVKNCNLFYRLVDLQPKFTILRYTKQERKKGKSGWTFSKKVLFFIENIFCYSISSLKIAK